MSSDDYWITDVIAKARKQTPAVPDAIWSQIEESLKGKLSERQLPPGELTAVAKALIVAITSASPKVQGVK